MSASKKTSKKTSKKVGKSPVKTLSYEVISTEQAGRGLYSFFAPADEVFSFVSINQKEEDSDGGYQRAASPARTRAITRYVEDGNPLPLSILVTLEKNAVTVGDGKISIKQKKSSGWVIDGQHRLVGAANADSPPSLPVVAFVGLDDEEQIQQFVTINKEAKGVPTSLYYSLLRKLPPKHSAADNAKERAADIGLLLRNDEESPFAGRIVSTTAPKQGQLSLVNFVRKVGPLVREDTGLLGSYSVEDQAKVIDNYYLAARSTFQKTFDAADSVFFSTVGFGGMMNFFPAVFSATLKAHKTFKVSDVIKTLSAVSHVDPLAWKKSGSGNAAELALGRDLIEELRGYGDDAQSQSSLAL